MSNHIQHLFEVIRNQGMEPLSVIERLADEARQEGYIDNNMYSIIQRTVSFPGLERWTTKRISRDIGVVLSQAKKLELDAYWNLWRYVTRSQLQSPLDMTLEELPWPENSGGTRTMNAFLKYFRRIPTARVVYDLIERHKETGELFYMTGFGATSARITKETFKKIGVDLPDYNPVTGKFFNGKQEI